MTNRRQRLRRLKRAMAAADWDTTDAIQEREALAASAWNTRANTREAKWRAHRIAKENGVLTEHRQQTRFTQVAARYRRASTRARYALWNQGSAERAKYAQAAGIPR